MGKGKRQKIMKINEKSTLFKGGYSCEYKFIIPIQDQQSKPASVVPPVDPPVATWVPQKRDQLVNEVQNLREEIGAIKAQMTEMHSMFESKLSIVSDMLELN